MFCVCCLSPRLGPKIFNIIVYGSVLLYCIIHHVTKFCSMNSKFTSWVIYTGGEFFDLQLLILTKYYYYFKNYVTGEYSLQCVCSVGWWLQPALFLDDIMQQQASMLLVSAVESSLSYLVLIDSLLAFTTERHTAVDLHHKQSSSQSSFQSNR